MQFCRAIHALHSHLLSLYLPPKFDYVICEHYLNSKQCTIIHKLITSFYNNEYDQTEIGQKLGKVKALHKFILC